MHLHCRWQRDVPPCKTRGIHGQQDALAAGFSFLGSEDGAGGSGMGDSPLAGQPGLALGRTSVLGRGHGLPPTAEAQGPAHLLVPSAAQSPVCKTQELTSASSAPWVPRSISVDGKSILAKSLCSAVPQTGFSV